MKKLRWFFGEFFVVLAGVLVAFLLNGWWESARERQREENYLQYIHRDLLASIALVGESEQMQLGSVDAVSKLQVALDSEPRMPDSLLQLCIIRSMSFSLASQVSATLSSLVSTGDIELIHDDSLRRSLSELLSLMRIYEEGTTQMGFQWLAPTVTRFADACSVEDLRYQVFNDSSLQEIAADSLSGFAPLQVLSKPKSIDMNHLVRSEEFRKATFHLSIAQNNLYKQHVNMLEDLEAALNQVEQHLEERGLHYDDSQEIRKMWLVK